MDSREHYIRAVKLRDDLIATRNGVDPQDPCRWMAVVRSCTHAESKLYDEYPRGGAAQRSALDLVRAVRWNALGHVEQIVQRGAQSNHSAS